MFCIKNIRILILFLPTATFAYNLYVDSPILFNTKTHIKQNQNEDFFLGYTVLLIKANVQELSSLIIGVPKGNYSRDTTDGNEIPIEPGIVYLCFIFKLKCVPIQVMKEDDEMGTIDRMSLNALIEKAHGWFGAAIAYDQETTFLTVCAPRTNIRIHRRYEASGLNTMHGVCYKKQLGEILEMEDKSFPTYNFSSEFWYNPLNGFSVHYPSYREGKRPAPTIQPVIGSPKHELFGSVRIMGQHTPVELPIGDDMAQFGYSLTSGYYFFDHQLLVAAGAPGWQYVGQVAIMDPRTEPLSIIWSIEGTEVGEFFGASLASGDLNNDGFDDLIVGSPHWGNDNGRVQIFFGHTWGFVDPEISIEGSVMDSLYGYTVTSGDLDADGFKDLIVAAPWEKSGVIYVYNGHEKLLEIKNLKPSQRIEGADVCNDCRRFGFSLSKPVDMLDIGVQDIAVGAHNTVTVLRPKLVLKTEITISTYPKKLDRLSTYFTLECCVKMTCQNKPLNADYKLSVIVDEGYKRATYDGSNKYYYTESNPERKPNHCVNRTIRLVTGNRNFIDPIDIDVTHQIVTSCRRQRVCVSQIEYKGAQSILAHKSLPFNIGCGMDDICHAFLFAKMEFFDLKDGYWIIGSGDLKLTLTIGNHAEPAYSTTVILHLPKGFLLRSVLPSCREEEINGTLMVACDVGNPLEKATEKKLTLDLDMSSMNNGSLNGTVHHFHLYLKTQSTNQGTMNISNHLHLRSNVSLGLSGKAEEKNYHFQHDDKKLLNTTFQHTYQISRSGDTTLFETRISIRIPYKIGDFEYLKLLNRPRVIVLGRFYECRVKNITILSSRTRAGSKKTPPEVVSLDTFAKEVKKRRAIDKTTNEKLSDTNGISMKHVEENITTESITVPIADLDVIHLNCSTHNVVCETIECNIGSLKTSQDVGKLQIYFLIETSALIDRCNGKEKIIYLSTEASLQVISPEMKFAVPGTEKSVSLTTTFYQIPNEESVSIWIIILSITFGLLALLVIAYVLKRFGFFARNRKKELESLKNKDSIPLESDGPSWSEEN